jgi:proline iminopeptidase
VTAGRLLVALVGLLLGLLGLAALALGAFWLSIPTPLAPPRTTADDPSLPALVIGGYRFHAEAHGPEDAPVVLVLPGGPGNDYRALLELRALSDTYRVVFYDQRGAGLSPRVPAGELSFAKAVTDLAAVAEHLSPTAPVRLIGHSYGAMLAAALLAEHPERVSHAALLEPGFLTPETGQEFLAKFQAGASKLDVAAGVALLRLGVAALKLPSDADPDARADYFFGTLATLPVSGNPTAGYFCGGRPRPESIASWRFGATLSQAILSAATDPEGRVTLDLSPGLARFPRPVLLVAGSCNTLIGPDVQERHARLFPSATVAVIDGAGHAMVADRPEATLAVLRTYLAAPTGPALP